MDNPIPTILDPNDRSISDVTRRMLADAFRDQGLQEVVYFPDGGRKMSYASALSKMIWQALVEGEMYFADGTVVKVSGEMKQWIEILKFVSTHIDGAAGTNNSVGQVNIFKVYKGIDTDRV